MDRRLLLLALGVAISVSTSVMAQTSPAMAVDGPANNATVAQPFSIAGWAVDTGAQSGTGIDAVHVWAYPQFGSNPDPMFVGSAELGGARPDVAAFYNNSQFTNSGFGFQVLGQQPGTYILVVSAHSAVSGLWDQRSVTVTITANPAMSIDGPTQNANVLQPFNVGGWAVDRAAATGTGVDTVHVYAFPAGGGPAIFIGASYMGGDRPDVGAAFGSRFAPSGFDVTFGGKPPGAYQIVAYAHSTLTNTFNQALSVNVNVDAPVAAPTFSLASGTYNETRTVSISPPPNAEVWFTTNGTEPTNSAPSILFSGQSVPIDTSQTLKAKAFRSGWLGSATATAVYELKLPTPTLGQAGGEFSSAPNVSLSVSPHVDNVTYRHTLNGDVPTASSPVAANPLSVPLNSTLSVRAFKDGWTASDEVVDVYVSDTPAPVSPGTLSPASVSATGFVAVGGVATFTLTGASLTGNADDIAAYRQGTSLPVAMTGASSFTVGNMIDGRNNLDVSGVDNQGLPFEGSVTVWAGARTVVAHAAYTDGTPLMGVTVTGYLDEDDRFSANVVTSGTFCQGACGNAPLFATPTASVLRVVAAKAGYREVETVVAPGAASASLVLEDENNDVSRGLAGWTTSAATGNVQVQGHAPNFLGWEQCTDCIVRQGAVANGPSLAACPSQYTDAPLVGGVTALKRLHVTELRETMDCLRSWFGMAAFAWTDSSLAAGTTPVRAVHVADLRTALDQIYTQAGASAPSYTDATLSGVAIKAAHVNELRAAALALFSDNLGPAAASGSGDADIRVTTKNVAKDIEQTVTRRFHAAPGHGAVTVKYRFASNEAQMNGSQPDRFVVTLRTLSAAGQTLAEVTDDQTVYNLWSELLPYPHATSWRERTLPTDGGQIVEAVFSVRNIGDAAGISLIDVDQIEERLVTITAFELYDGPNRADTAYQALDFLSVSTHNYDQQSGRTTIRGTIWVNGPATDRLQSLNLEILEGGQLKHSEPLASSAAGLLNQPFGNGGILLTTPTVMFRIPSSDLQAALNQTADGLITLQVRAITNSGLQVVGPLGRDVEKLARYTNGNRFPGRDVDRCIVSLTQDAYWGQAAHPYPCNGDDWALPSVSSRTNGIASLVFANGGSGVACNDFSNMNGGHFPPHNSHNLGLDVDCRFGTGNSAKFDLKKANANKLVELLNGPGTRIDFIYATYSIGSEFWNEIKNATLADGTRVVDPADVIFMEQNPNSGRMMFRGRIRNFPGHDDHFHIRWLQ